MNRQQRRQAERRGQPAFQAPDEWEAGVRALHDASGGAVMVQIIRPIEAVSLLALSLCGDQVATATLDCLSKLLARIAAAPADAPPECATCRQPLRAGRYAFALALPHRHDPRQALGLAVCEACAPGTDVAKIKAKAIDAFRELWPDLREITVTGEGGNA